MNRMVQARSSSATPTIRARTVDSSELVANPWNPNRMTAQMYAKALESIKLYGFIDPLTVRPFGNAFQIIDGEHRWKAGLDLGMTVFPCVVVTGLSDEQAKKLTIVLNELHGQADPAKMGDLLNDLLSSSSMEDLLIGFPYSPDVLVSLAGLPALPPLEPPPAPAAGDVQSKEPWTERTFRMPKSVSLVVDEALEKAKDGEELEAWQALERVAADYLA